MAETIDTVATTAYTDQRPGTSGLRKKVAEFRRPHYLENFVQSIFDAIPADRRETLVLGGDGRYFNTEAASVIVRMAAGNGFSRVVVGQNAILSTPAVSNLIRARAASGGIVLSASHNPGGPEGDFGVKFDNSSGSPAPESVTEAIHYAASRISQYRIVRGAPVSFDRIDEFRIGATVVEVVDPVAEYQRTMESSFDFDRLRDGFSSGRLSICYDAMHAVTGPYASRILETELGAPPGSVINSIPREDFGGKHPDPNLAHASDLLSRMAAEDAPLLGAASDGDGDRNLILGRGFFVTPSDSLAILTAHAHRIPQFRRGLNGVARSMPTSRAVDRVAQELGVDCYETPTGWKFFGSLLDAGLINLCGEESFGTGGDHVREKDGLWAVLAWLTLLTELDCPVEDVVRRHWRRFGRYIYCRHDYEGINIDQANALMEHLSDSATTLAGSRVNGEEVLAAGHFRYHDPVEEITTGSQGIQVLLDNDARIVYRLSGTGTSGATLRVYLEQYRRAPREADALEANAALGDRAAKIARIEHFTGMDRPNVRT